LNQRFEAADGSTQREKIVVELDYPPDEGKPRTLMACGPVPASMLKFETVAVVVRDEKKATRFWKDKVGLRVVTSFPHWVTVAPRGSNVRLHLCPDSRPEKGNTGYLFSTKDAKREEARLRKLGVKITKPTKKEEWGTIFWFADPDGNEFQVIED
jgi:predicted enzyme related to lactoylglutathione lyase